MTDYGELAQKLSNRLSHAQPAREPGSERGMDPAVIYERVKLRVSDEIEKANVELRKRKLAPVERLFLPSYHGRLCLSFGPLLCTADLQEAKGHVTAVITGPPNQQEISRKDFALNEYRPEQIAVEIVSGLLMGEFS
jgi:hypothetical protein